MNGFKNIQTKIKKLKLRLRIWVLKKKAKALMWPWINDQKNSDCGNELLEHLCRGNKAYYAEGCELAYKAMRLEAELKQL